jgi:hypothetical protein
MTLLYEKEFNMSKFSKILMGVWVCLALLSFVCAFFCPTFPMIIGLVFGGSNMLVILSVVISYFQLLYYRNKLDKEFKENGLQLQESEETPQEEA